LIASAVVLGFDPASRSWVTSAQAASFDRVPPLDGALAVDDASRAAMADDYGHIVQRQPLAVLTPGSVADIVRMVQYARKHRLSIAARGQAHTTYGQSQVAGGIVVDMRALNTIHSIAADRAVVDAGVLWSALLRATLAQSLTPPVLTDYIELSVGGTLSVGGVGGASHRYGAQVDNVLELEVVTGEGKLETCSASRKRELFESVLAGLGQFGIITRAVVRLIPAEQRARVFTLPYRDLATFTADQRRLAADERFSYVEGQIVPAADGGWSYVIEAARFYTPPAAPDHSRLLAGLSYARGGETVEDKTYFDFVNRLAPTVEFLKSIGVWGLPHPWVDLFLPDSETNRYVGETVATLTLADTGQGPVLLYPVKTERFTRPLLRLPDEPIAFLLSILRTGSPDPNVIAAMLRGNRALYERNRDRGGKRYPIDAVPFSQQDWKDHFRPRWGQLVSAKRRYDPDNLLTPGQGIF
jgi:hypothetical protein